LIDYILNFTELNLDFDGTNGQLQTESEFYM